MISRRLFVLGAFAFAATASAAPAADDSAAMSVLSDGWAAARTAGLALLVFVIPADPAARWSRGQALGEWLNHGGERADALIGQTVWVCATAAQVRAFAPGVTIDGEPWMILLDPGQVPTRGLAIAVDPGPEPTPEDWAERLAAEDAVIDRHIAAQTDALEAALIAWGRTAEGDAAALASVKRAEAQRASEPAGAYWGWSGGCGVSIEGQADSMGLLCGMGHTPARSQRFLYFFSREGN
jgi:hypothetical protein